MLPKIGKTRPWWLPGLPKQPDDKKTSVFVDVTRAFLAIWGVSKAPFGGPGCFEGRQKAEFGSQTLLRAVKMTKSVRLLYLIEFFVIFK